MELKTYIATLAGPFGHLHGYKEMYLKEDVDTRIQDLEAKVLSLDSQLMVEKMHARNFCDQRDCAESENKKLLRALWLTRAERAASWQIHFALCHNHSIEREFTINGASTPRKGMVTMRIARDWAIIWKKVEWLCKNKAENFKE